MPEKRSKKSRLPSEATSLTVERKVAGSSLEEDVASFPSLFRVKIDLYHVPNLACWYSIIVMWQLAIDGLYCKFHFRKYSPRQKEELYLKKKLIE